MVHLLILAAKVAGVWTVLALPLAVVVGSILRRAHRTSIPGGPR